MAGSGDACIVSLKDISHGIHLKDFCLGEVNSRGVDDEPIADFNHGLIDISWVGAF